MYAWVLSPPVAFVAVLLLVGLLALLFSRLALRGGKKAPGAGKAYACGEDIPDHLSQPDYSQFFSFAFFFTIAHVATLMLTTVPAESPRILAMALVYSAVIIVSLIVLFRR